MHSLRIASASWRNNFRMFHQQIGYIHVGVLRRNLKALDTLEYIQGMAGRSSYRTAGILT